MSRKVKTQIDFIKESRVGGEYFLRPTKREEEIKVVWENYGIPEGTVFNYSSCINGEIFLRDEYGVSYYSFIPAAFITVKD